MHGRLLLAGGETGIATGRQASSVTMERAESSSLRANKRARRRKTRPPVPPPCFSKEASSR